MRRAALAALVPVVAVAVAGVAEARRGKRKGKVVRVERGSSDAALVPRLCYPVQPDGTAYCYGAPPQVGEVGIVVTEVGPVGSARVTAVTPQLDNCQNVIAWTINLQATSGGLDKVTGYGTALFDVATTGATRTLVNNGQVAPPGRYPGESFYAAVDHDRDDQPDYMLTYYYCDATGAPLASPGGTFCMVNYVRDRGQYVERRVDIVKNCY